jgi:sulfite reductase alpha subunit-like flavoprotein
MPASHGGSRKALVLYGSETGNAQDAAEELGRLLRRFRFASVVDALDAASLVGDDVFNADR